MTLRFGVAGLEHWYNAYPAMDAVRRLPGARITVVAANDAGRAREVAARHDAHVAPTFVELATCDDVDVVLCFTRVSEAAAVAVAGCEAGKAVVGMKPAGMTLAEADAVVAACRGTGGLYFPGELAWRFMPGVQALRRLAEEGRLGEVRLAGCRFHAGLPQESPGATSPGWFADPRHTPGGAFIDHAIYHVDLLRWFLDADPLEVQATMAKLRHRDLPLEDYGHATFAFGGGGAGWIEDTWTANPDGTRITVEVTGSEGSAHFDATLGQVALNGRAEFGGWVRTTPAAPRESLFEHVRRCLLGDAAPIADAAWARTNLAICLAAYRSASEGRSVRIGGEPPG